MAGARLHPYLLLAVAALCWGGNFVLGRAVHADIPPVTLSFWRWAVAGAVLIPLAGAAALAHRRTLLMHWRLILTLAVLGVVSFHIAVYWGLQTTTATNGSLIVATLPVVIPVLSFFINGDVLTGRQAAGIALSLVGVAIIVFRGSLSAVVGLALTPGDGLMLIAMVVWALYSVLLRRVPAELPRLALLLAIVGVGIVFLAPLYAWEVASKGGIALSWSNLLSIAYVALFASVIAYICWNSGVDQVGANVAGQFIHLQPASAAILAIAFLGERLAIYHAAGIAAIAVGIVLTTRGAKAGAAPAAPSTRP